METNFITEQKPHRSREESRKVLLKPKTDHFFEAFSRVQALNLEPTEPNGGANLFPYSRQELEKALANSKKRESADLHALLALIHWLYPTTDNFDKVGNSKSAFDNASSAIEAKSTSLAAKSVSLFVQLRVLPFLIQSGAQNESELISARKKALSLVESLGREQGWAGVLLEGIGYSFCQHEHDLHSALQFLTRAKVKLLKGPASAKSSFHTTFLSAITAVVFWDIGYCNENLGERESECARAVELYQKARVSYSRAALWSKKSPWLLYRSLSHYAVAGALLGEAELSAPKNQIRKRTLLKAAIDYAERASAIMNNWTEIESSMLSGSLNSQLYQNLALLESGKKKMKLLYRSFELASKAHVSYVKVSGGRYSAANLGDILVTLAQCHYEEALHSTKTQKVHHLVSALDHCQESQVYFDKERHADRLVKALMLGARIAHELAASGRSADHNNELMESQCREAVALCVSHGWSDKIPEANDLLHCGVVSARTI